MLHGAEPGQEPPALVVVAESVDHPGGHVVDRDVGRRAGTGGRQLLHDQRRVETAERRCRRRRRARRCRRSRVPPPRAASRPERPCRRPSARPAATCDRRELARAVSRNACWSSESVKSIGQTVSTRSGTNSEPGNGQRGCSCRYTGGYLHDWLHDLRSSESIELQYDERHCHCRGGRDQRGDR